MDTKKNTIVIAAFINIIVFVVFFLLFHPVYDSREDVYALYLLSGGYGDEPTEMLHYNHILHPFLGWLIKDLFLLNSKVNWYTLALIFAHYFSCTIILGYIIEKRNTLVAYLSYAVLFVVFEGYFLLYPDFTGASLILGITALLYLLLKSWSGFLRYRHCIIAGAILLLASFYRIHAMIPLAGIALPFFILTLNTQARRRSLVTLMLSAFCIFLFNRVHQTYYKVIKPDWAQEESYRQKVFRFFNEQSSLKPLAPGEKWYEEHEVAVNGLIMDTSFMPATRLDSMYHDLKKAGNPQWHLSADWRKWFYLNNRLFIATTLLFFLIYGIKRKTFPAAIISLALLIAGFGYLLLKAKAPPYIFISSLTFICFAIFLHTEGYLIIKQKAYKPALLVALSLFIMWGVLRLYRTSLQNRDTTWLFKQEYAEIASHPANLFIGLNGFQTNKFDVFDVPTAYPLYNYLHAERFAGDDYPATLERFGITTLANIFTSRRVLFWGELSPPQQMYFEKIAGRPLRFVQQTEFKQAKVWRIE